ncbi:MAG: DNA (cytosine-5-)-methyltransferase [Eubacterium sp.]|nr:DNA (cytosine-5-)-methyltransferase [Eubacterium sp.]
MMPRIIDLFAGLGGIRLGFQQAMEELGLETECVFVSEIKPYAIQAYKGFYGNENVYGDITLADTDRDIPDFDYLLAGFPCQPFSSAGNRNGFADTRGTLFFEIERILQDKINAKRPAKGFLLENVEGLINHDNGNTLNIIITHLENLGYKVNHRLLDSKEFGLPQSRKRVYIVGTLDEAINLDKFEHRESVLGDILQHGLPTVETEFTRRLFTNYTTREIIGKSIKDKRGGENNIHSWDIDLKGKTSLEERKLLNVLLCERRKKHWAEVIGIKWMDGMPLTEAQISTFYNVPNLHDILEHLTDMGYLVYEYPKKQVRGDNGTVKRVPDTTKEKGYNIVAGKLSFEFSKILDPNDIAPTLVAMDVAKLGVVDGAGIRKLTIRECQRLCGYPDNYNLDELNEEDAFDLLGNTVCVPVIKDIALRLGQNYINNVGGEKSNEVVSPGDI